VKYRAETAVACKALAVEGATHGAPALPAAQPSVDQQILMLAVARTLLPLPRESSLGGLEGLHVDNRRHRYGNPLCARHFPPAGFFVGVAFASHALLFAIIQRADVGRVAQ
jgi:hypothetical protein